MHSPFEPHSHLMASYNNLTSSCEIIPHFRFIVNRAIAEKQAGQPDIPDKNANAESERISSLETELREMRERYLHVSLQYAQVEAQREELVMQLKSVKREKRWFS